MGRAGTWRPSSGAILSLPGSLSHSTPFRVSELLH
jgi:hypothetical protein